MTESPESAKVVPPMCLGICLQSRGVVGPCVPRSRHRISRNPCILAWACWDEPVRRTLTGWQTVESIDTCRRSSGIRRHRIGLRGCLRLLELLTTSRMEGKGPGDFSLPQTAQRCEFDHPFRETARAVSSNLTTLYIMQVSAR